MRIRACCFALALAASVSSGPASWAMPQQGSSSKAVVAALDPALVGQLLAKMKQDVAAASGNATASVIEGRLAGVIEESGASCPLAVEALRQLAADGGIRPEARAGASALEKVTGSRCVTGTGAVEGGRGSSTRGFGLGGGEPGIFVAPFTPGGGGSDYTS